MMQEPKNTDVKRYELAALLLLLLFLNTFCIVMYILFS